VVVVDDWQGDLAAQATHVLLPRPRTDPAWLYGLAASVWLEAPVSLSLAAAAAACGVPATDLQAVADALRSATRVAVVYDPTSPTCMTGLASAQALAALATSLGYAGAACGILPLAERCNSLGVLEMGLVPHLLSGYQPLDSAEIRDRFAAVWDVPLPSEPGRTAAEMVRAEAWEELAGLVLVADGSEPGELARLTGEVLSAASPRLSCLIVLESFPSSLSEHATVIFPRLLPGELEGTFTNLEGRVQLLRPQVPPPEEMRPEWRLLADLAAALDCPISYGSAADILKEVATLTPAYFEISHDRLKPGGRLRPQVGVRSEREAPLRPPSPEEVKAAAAEVSPSPSADFPFLLVTTRMDLPWELDGLVRHASTLRREVGPDLGAYVRIHPEEARQLGLRPAQRVNVASSQGQVELAWQADPAVPPGRLIAPQRHLATLRPVLGEVQLDPESGAPLYPAAAVKVSRAA
jgi:predicted molibdopterin-dependent oxidoreductase YjgC